MTTFADIVESADALNQEEKEELIRILQARLREEKREQFLADIEEGRREYAAGKCQPMSVDEIVRKIAE